jgi:hypothetical protein
MKNVIILGAIYPQLKPYAGSHTVWNGLVPDINMPQAVNLYQSIFTKQHIPAFPVIK